MAEERTASFELTEREMTTLKAIFRDWYPCEAKRDAHRQAGRADEAAEAASKLYELTARRADLALEVIRRIRNEIQEDEGADPGVPCAIDIDTWPGIIILMWPANNKF